MVRGCGRFLIIEVQCLFTQCQDARPKRDISNKNIRPPCDIAAVVKTFFGCKVLHYTPVCKINAIELSYNIKVDINILFAIK